MSINFQEILKELEYRVEHGIIDLTKEEQVTKLVEILRENGISDANEIAQKARVYFSFLSEAKQSLETEINYMKIGEVMEYLSGKMSKMILYTYDAFLIDTHPIERENILNDIKVIMERGGFPVKVEEGENYNNLEVIS